MGLEESWELQTMLIMLRALELRRARESAREVRRDAGLLRSGSHSEGREFCALEFEAQVRGRAWGDAPITLPDLRPINDNSIDVAYCTVVFMHLESWDRYSYVKEALRVLRPGGKLYVDNVNLCCDGGWAIFETHRKFSPAERPDHITVCSTPQELQEYLKRAGFEQPESYAGEELISV
jgi:SAM-dependent methyltransferase